MTKPSILLMTFIAVIASLQCHAQKFFFGPSVKAGISQIIFVKTDTIPDHSISNRLNFSLQAGAYAEYKFANRFGAGLELLYWWQNGKLKDDFSYADALGNSITQNDVYKAHVSYFSVPVYFQYYMKDVSLLLGAQSGFEFSETGNLTSTTTTNGAATNTTESDIDLNFENFDIGIKAGVLYKVADNIVAGLEYYNGRVNLSKNNDLPFSSRNQYFYGSLRYNIIRGKRDVIYYN
ncbi:MAG: PorT family protein [Chitinophagales bacterium]|nr:PorT family protein [Chitinophagales bacterium]